MKLRPDLAVIPECAEPDILRREVPEFAFSDCDWSGANPVKGLGVFAFNGLTLRLHQSWRREFHLFLPLEVRGRVTVNLLAVWAFKQGEKPEVGPNPGTTLLAIEYYRPFLTAQPSIVAGDFNGNVFWDKKRRYHRFAEVDAILQSLGLVSAYHHHTGVALGEETASTYFEFRRTEDAYHIDYVYIPVKMAGRMREMTVCQPSEWLTASDHVPVVVEIEME
jgi:exodeoxyribonuclease-3